MDIKSIKTLADHRAALEGINSLMTAKRGTPKGDRLDVLASLFVTYETRMRPKHPSPTRIIDAGDGSGDGVLPLPDAYP